MDRKIRKRAGQVLQRYTELNTLLQETNSGIRIVKAFAMEDYERERFCGHNERVFRALMRISLVEAGLEKTQFITNKELFSLEHLPSSMIVIGAGPVAIEMAQTFCRLGTKVSVIQRSGQILSKEDQDMADMVMDVMTAEGVTFHLDSAILEVRDHGSEREVLIKDREGRTISLRAEKILVALGRRPNLAGLGLEGISVEFDRKGLKLDNRLRTNHKHIYGAGDITGEHQFTHAAGYEGGIVLSNAVTPPPTRYE